MEKLKSVPDAYTGPHVLVQRFSNACGNYDWEALVRITLRHNMLVTAILLPYVAHKR